MCNFKDTEHSNFGHVITARGRNGGVIFANLNVQNKTNAESKCGIMNKSRRLSTIGYFQNVCCSDFVEVIRIEMDRLSGWGYLEKISEGWLEVRAFCLAYVLGRASVQFVDSAPS